MEVWASHTLDQNLLCAIARHFIIMLIVMHILSLQDTESVSFPIQMCGGPLGPTRKGTRECDLHPMLKEVD
jgi:hypothetical protein